MQPKLGGTFHLKLNIGESPLANKYREGKNALREIVEREPFEASLTCS